MCYPQNKRPEICSKSFLRVVSLPLLSPSNKIARKITWANENTIHSLLVHFPLSNCTSKERSGERADIIWVPAEKTWRTSPTLWGQIVSQPQKWRRMEVECGLQIAMSIDFTTSFSLKTSSLRGWNTRIHCLHSSQETCLFSPLQLGFQLAVQI